MRVLGSLGHEGQLQFFLEVGEVPLSPEDFLTEVHADRLALGRAARLLRLEGHHEVLPLLVSGARVRVFDEPEPRQVDFQDALGLAGKGRRQNQVEPVEVAQAKDAVDRRDRLDVDEGFFADAALLEQRFPSAELDFADVLVRGAEVGQSVAAVWSAHPRSWR